MNGAEERKIRLVLSPRGEVAGPLYPEEVAAFDLVLRNDGEAPADATSLTGNLDTPVIVPMDEQERPLGEFDNLAMGERMVGDLSTLSRPSRVVVTFQPGQEDRTWINLWSFTAAYPPGSYLLQVRHTIDPAQEPVESNLQGFDIVGARVESAGHAFDVKRTVSTLAWLAGSESSDSVRLLVRESGSVGHASLHQGGTRLGEFTRGSRVSVGQPALDSGIRRVGWVAVTSPEGTAELLQHTTTFPSWRSESVELGIESPRPVARFPDRGHAVYLATGRSGDAGRLVGFTVRHGVEPGPVWSVPLAGEPVFAVAGFADEGPITIVYGIDDGRESMLYRIRVEEDGQLVGEAEEVLRSPHAIAALVTSDFTPEHPSFLALLADRTRADRHALVRVPTSGEVEPYDLRPLPGWPMEDTALEEDPVAVPSVDVALEAGHDGGVWLAMLDGRGDLYGGRIDQPLSRLREAGAGELTGLHVAASREHLVISCFEADGRLLHSQIYGGHH